METLFRLQTEQKLWKLEDECCHILSCAIKRGAATEDIVGSLLVEATREDNEDCREHIIRLAYKVVTLLPDNEVWPMSEKTSWVVEQLLDMFYHSLFERGSSALLSLKSGIQLCLINVIDRSPSDLCLIVLRVITSWIIDENNS